MKKIPSYREFLLDLLEEPKSENIGATYFQEPGLSVEGNAQINNLINYTQYLAARANELVSYVEMQSEHINTLHEEIERVRQLRVVFPNKEE
jgi:hypothetical protein